MSTQKKIKIEFTQRNGQKTTERRTLKEHRDRLDVLGAAEAKRQECAPTHFGDTDFAYQAEAAAILAIL